MGASESTGASVVIPTTVRRDTVAPVVEAALESVAGTPGGEVIVVVNGPTQGRLPLELRSPALRVVECPMPNAGAARKLGVDLARNEAILFTDDDCLVSAGWATGLTRRLYNGEVAVATPLKMRCVGPWTSLLDHQRLYHPRPIDASSVYFGLLASAGVRRDLTAVEFDEDMDAGDDVQFGSRLRDAGATIAYDTDVPPPIHAMPEDMETMAARFFRYGAANAMLLVRKDRPEFSIPFAPALYTSLCANDFATPRRYEELADPNLRELFATLERIQLGSLLVGFLTEAGRLLDREIIRVDRDGLVAGWLEIGHRLQSEFAWNGDWDRLPVELERLLTPRETTAPALAEDVSENLTRNSTLVIGAGAGADADLDRGGERVRRRAEEIWVTVNEILGDLREGRVPADLDLIATRMREHGIAFRDGMQTMEAIALGPIQDDRARA
jgi:hypothetical protein